MNYYDIEKILNYTFYSNTVRDYLIIFSIFILSLILLKLIKSVFVKFIEKISKSTHSEIDDKIANLIRHIGWPFYVIVSLYVSTRYLEVDSDIRKYFLYGLIIMLGFYGGYIVSKLIDFGITKLKEHKEDGDSKMLDIFNKIVKSIVWLLLIIIVLQNLGIEVSGLIAGLGITGIAIAFATQNILADIFSSLLIFVDKTFEVGDFIVIGSKDSQDRGIVKKIGIRSTRIQTLEGEELVLSNKDLVASRVRNHKKIKNRRISCLLKLNPETESEKLKNIYEIIKNLIDNIELAQFYRCRLIEFNEAALTYEIVYIIDSSSFDKYMEIQEKILLGIKEKFAKDAKEVIVK